MSLIIFLPRNDQVPQWKQIYFDHQLLNQILQLLQKCHQTINKINQGKKSDLGPKTKIQIDVNDRSERALHQFDNTTTNRTSFQLNSVELYDMMNKWCVQFTSYSFKCSIIVNRFILMRHLQLKQKLASYKQFLQIIRSQKRNITLLLDNLYLEAYLVHRAISFNIVHQSQINLKFQNFTSQYPQHFKKFIQSKKLKRLSFINQGMLQDIQTAYVVTSQERNNTAFQVIDSLRDNNPGTTSNQFIMMGVTMGVLVFMVTLLVMTDIVNNVVLETNKIFTDHFPIWRGASYILLYLWILGLNLLFFQRSQINYRLIFQFRQHVMPQSRYVFLRAGVLSVTYIVLFYIFTLQIGQKISTRFYFYGTIFWGILIAQLFLTAPFNESKSKRGRFYLYKILKKILLTPFVRITFTIMWVTDQLNSFNQPFGDLYYTVCFTASRNQPLCQRYSPFASSGFILALLLLRLIQGIKNWYVNAKKKQKPGQKLNLKSFPYLNVIRGCLSILTTIFALWNRLNLFNGVFPLWLTFSITTTLFAWFVDIKMDWGILDFKQKYFLRKKLLFPQAKYIYYFLAIFNLILRTAWVLTISSISSILIGTSGFPLLIFVMTISYLQILRRGAWNILRIQYQHIKNCDQFKATISDTYIFQKVKQKAKKRKEILDKNRKINSNLNFPGQRYFEKIIEYIIQKYQKKKNLQQTRMLQTKKLFRQQLQIKGNMRQKIKRQLKLDRGRLRSIRLRASNNWLLSNIFN